MLGLILFFIFNIGFINSAKAKSTVEEKKYYDYQDFNEKTNYYPIEVNKNKYNSTGTCVTIKDLIAYHYTDKKDNLENKANVFPENFCYGMINYNLTREDFRDIITKNVNAFKNYRTILPIYLFQNYTGNNLLDDGCIGYFKLITCLFEFPACYDNGNGTFTAHPICESICVNYKRRCTTYFFQSFCSRNSTYKYCPDTHSDKGSFLGLDTNYFLKIILLLLFTFV